jgi:uncharacterized membrane protein
MDTKQLLEKSYQDIKKLEILVRTLKSKSTNQNKLIKQLTDGLESLKRQYEDMLRNSDETIASQAEQINRLTDENRKLHRQLEELKKNTA